MPKQQVNQLLALPWAALAKQIQENANTAVNCIVSDEAVYEKEATKKIVGVEVKRRVWMKWDSGEFSSQLQSPPGYEHLNRDRLVIAAPLEGHWRAKVTCGFKSALKVWVAGNKVFSDNPSLTQSIELFDLRFKVEAKMKTTDATRPRVDSVKVKAHLGLRLKGLINKTWGPEDVELEFTPPDKYRFRIPLDVNIASTSIDGMPKAGFEGDVVLKLGPEKAGVGGTGADALDLVGAKISGDLQDEIEDAIPAHRAMTLAYDGAIKFRLFQVSIAGQKYPAELSVPFSFDTGVSIPTPASWWRFLPEASDIPKKWGENPPDALKKHAAPRPRDEMLAAAIELEQSVMPDSALSDVSTGAIASSPYHAPHGLIYEVKYPGCGDSGPAHKPELEGKADCAIWTGHFLAAEALRYATAPSAEVLERVRTILGGIEKLFQVTGIPGLFARAALPKDWRFQTDPRMWTPTVTSGSPCKPGDLERTYRAQIDNRQWCGYGRGEDPITRDAYIGLMLGMTCAWKYVPDAAIHETIKRLVTDALSHLVIKGKWNVLTPAGESPSNPTWQPIRTTFIHQFVHQLALLRVGKTVNPAQFGGLYDQYCGAADAAWIPVWGTTIEPIQKYYKFNLSHAALTVLLLLEDNAGIKAHYRFAFDILRRSIRHHRNPHFNLVRVLIEDEAQRAVALGERSGFDNDVTVQDETISLLADWLTRRDYLAGERNLPQRRPPDPSYYTESAGKNASNPAVKYTPVGTSDSMGSFMTKYAMPVCKRPGTDFLWQRPPFATTLRQCDGKRVVSAQNPRRVSPGIDYLLPFWMAEYVRLFVPVPAQPRGRDRGDDVPTPRVPRVVPRRVPG